MDQGTLFIISAPSGGGKTTLVNALLSELPGIVVSVSHTTRAPRKGEIEGKNYFFVEEQRFQELQQQQAFLEYAKVFNYWYGTSKKWVMDQLSAGIDVILEIDWQGAQRIRSLMSCVSIFILPPSREALLSRLEARQQDSAEIIIHRMNQAGQEISHCLEYDFIVINDNFDSALMDLVAIMKAERVKAMRQQQRNEALLKSLIGI